MNRKLERLGLLKLFTPEIFEEPGAVLYVGAYNRRFFASAPLFKAGNEITVLEIWEPFIEDLRASRWGRRCAYIVQGDVCKIAQLELPHDEYDYALWFHGPEHIARKDFNSTVKGLELRTKKLVVMTCPWGQFKHGIAHDNPYTEHKGHYYPEDFQRLRYRVACIGPVDRPGSQLQAWRRLKRG